MIVKMKENDSVETFKPADCDDSDDDKWHVVIRTVKLALLLTSALTALVLSGNVCGLCSVERQRILSQTFLLLRFLDQNDTWQLLRRGLK